jgi:hypothetical protein
MTNPIAIIVDAGHGPDSRGSLKIRATVFAALAGVLVLAFAPAPAIAWNCLDLNGNGVCDPGEPNKQPSYNDTYSPPPTYAPPVKQNYSGAWSKGYRNPCGSLGGAAYQQCMTNAMSHSPVTCGGLRGAALQSCMGRSLRTSPTVSAWQFRRAYPTPPGMVGFGRLPQVRKH